MYGLRNIDMGDYQESVTTGQTHRQTDGQTLDKVIPKCHYASQMTKKCKKKLNTERLKFQDFKKHLP